MEQKNKKIHNKGISRTKIDRHMKDKTNPVLRQLILKLKKSKNNDYLKIAYFLAKPNRKSVSVNLDKINKFSKENETVLVPGKVLGLGDINKKIIISAFSFSEPARQKLKKAGCEIKTIKELSEKNSKFKLII